jgi:glycosyltransferase involved in cell wall biosynthesis
LELRLIQAEKTDSNNNPKVAITMATYNPCLSYLIDQISSIRNQTHKNWQCIIVDDNSREEKFENILQVVGADPRFVIHRNGNNIGSFKTFERALTLVPGNADFICYCDQDDIWISTKLEIQLQAFADDSVFLVHTDQSLIDEKGRVFVASCWTLEGRSVLQATTDLLLFRNLITGCTTMFRKKVLDTALPFYPLRPLPEMYHHDMWVAMHACIYGQVLGIKEPLVLYRQHSGNLVGVAALKRNLKFRGLASRAGAAFKERMGLRDDFINSLEKNNRSEAQKERLKLSYLDNPISMFCEGIRYVWDHPLFFRTLIMLAVGSCNWHYKKLMKAEPEEVF